MNIAQPRIKVLSLVALFTALSVIGSMIKLPSPYGTVALDSCPAFVAALLISPAAGAWVGFFGHILTSWNAGFPLSIPIHLFVALQMAAICWSCGMVAGKGRFLLALIVAAVLNGVAAPAMFIFFDGFGTAFFLTMLLPLLFGSVVNAALAGLIVKALRRSGNG
jgi:uncharacterized membrane protein